MATEEKQIILKRTWYDWVLEILSVLSLLYGLMPFFILYGKGESGSLSTSFLMITFYLLSYFLEYNYQMLNYPVKVTDQNKVSLYRIAVRLLRELRFLATLFFAININEIGQKYTIINGVLIITIIASTGYHIFKMYKEG